MDSAIAAVAGELVSRFISFAFHRYCSSSNHEELEKQRQRRLQHLLTRAHAVVEEADARYIRNSAMLMQLKMVSEAMYQGYHALDSSRFQLQFHDDDEAEEAEESTSMNNKVGDLSVSFSSAARRLSKRPSTVVLGDLVEKDKVAALENLETAMANIAEFVVLLGRCDERLSRRPYDTYLHIGNFMFGRHTEKQKVLNFLLQQHNPSDGDGDGDGDAPPPVLPIIGALGVGKKTLVAHVCADDRVRSKFASTLHLNGDNFLTIVDHEKASPGGISSSSLVVVEFVSDVDDVQWKEFYSFLTRATSGTRGSKVIIISKVARLARFGSARPVFLNPLSFEELWYLFKNLAFGSADPAEHPRLLHIAQRFAKQFYQRGSLVSANALADVMRSNLDAQVWISILNRCRKVMEKNLFAYGQPPSRLLEQGREVDLTDFVASPALNPLRVIPFNSTKTELPKVSFGELLLDPSVRPKGEFRLLTWESRLPPYTSFIHFVPDSSQDMPQEHSLSRRKREAVPF